MKEARVLLLLALVLAGCGLLLVSNACAGDDEDPDAGKVSEQEVEEEVEEEDTVEFKVEKRALQAIHKHIGVAFYAGLCFLAWAIGLALHWVLFAAFPNRTQRLTALFERSPWKSLILGIVNLFVLAVVSIVTIRFAPPLGLLFSLIFLVGLFVGIHARSRALGRRILKAAGNKSGALAEITVGWSALAMLWAIPFLGWTLIFIYFYAGGLGAVTFSLFEKPATGGGANSGARKR